MEYMEERPPLLMNIGMGTKIRNFFRKQSSTDLPPYTCEDGETVILEPTDDSPFLGDVGPGEIVQGLDSNLFKAPIMRHDPPMTDFLLIRSKDKRRAYIREIPAVYAVGQQQPLVKVPAPNSRSANNFMKNRLQTFIYRLFKKRSTSQQRLRISDVCSAFPNQSETAIRKRLKDCADFQRGGDDSGWWTVKEGFELPSEEDLRKMLAPEKVCAYESMQAGQQYLADIGIENITNTSGLSTGLLPFCFFLFLFFLEWRFYLPHIKYSVHSTKESCATSTGRDSTLEGSRQQVSRRAAAYALASHL